MENYLHDDSNVITMNSLNTTIANAKEDFKLGGAGFDEYDIFSPPSFEEEICFDNTMSPIADNCNDACDIFSSPTESIPFQIPMGIVERVMDDRYAGDGSVHPSAHLLKLTELCELFKVAGLSQEEIMKKLFPLSLKDNAKDWYELLDNSQHSDWKKLESLFYSKFYPLHEMHLDNPCNDLKALHKN